VIRKSENFRHPSRAAGDRGVSCPISGENPPRSARLVDGGRILIDPGARTDARIAAIAARQRARVARTQLLDVGITSGAIQRRLTGGRLARVYAGVYSLPATQDVPLATETAALLACGEHAVLSGHSAATLWCLRPGVARPVHVTLLAGRGPMGLDGLVLHRSSTITAADVRLHQGLPVTSPARTLLDVAATLPDRDIERLLDEALFALRIVSRSELEDTLARAGNHPGRARLARVARGHTRSTKADSPPEEAMLTMIRAAGLPEPDMRVPMLDYRLDFYWPAQKLAVEVDAYGTHGGAHRFEDDRRRDARLLAERGVGVLRVTRLAIEQRRLEVVATLARAIATRETEIATRETEMGARETEMGARETELRSR
jgi:very-short-patch-repair endonuclease